MEKDLNIKVSEYKRSSETAVDTKLDELMAMLQTNAKMLDQYALYFNHYRFPYGGSEVNMPMQWIAQMKGDCPVSRKVHRVAKLMTTIDDLDTEDDLCDSALYMSKDSITYRWVLTCEGCASVNIEDLMPPTEAAPWIQAAEKIAPKRSDGMQFVSLSRVVPHCK